VDWPASPEHQAAFDRAKFEVRVRELSEQLGEATTRAGNERECERAANALSERVIAELRAEVGRLRDELNRARSTADG